MLSAFPTQNWPEGVSVQQFGSETRLARRDVAAMCFMGHVKHRKQY